MNKPIESHEDNANRDPITGAPGAHPIGTGVGALAGGTAAGLAGKGVAAAIDPAREDAYWRDHFSERPYVEHGSSYDDYGPAYSFGLESVSRYPGKSFDEAEPEMSLRWVGSEGTSRLHWGNARNAVRDAWLRGNGVV
ncbi:MAG TPA: hypothetical protein VFY12_01820 [Arenimonas sp.]|nr:hypothetical protein [Arenimonas sp.]